MKNIILTALAATTLTASAQDQIITEKGRAIEATLSTGYLFGIEESYTALEITKECEGGCASSRWGLKLSHLSDNQDFFGLATLDTDLIQFGLSYTQFMPVSDDVSLYSGLGGGLVYIDATATSAVASDSEDALTYYIEANAGIRKDFTENFYGHLGVKALHMRNTDVGGLDTDFDAIDFGVELGFTYSF